MVEEVATCAFIPPRTRTTHSDNLVTYISCLGTIHFATRHGEGGLLLSV